ncbi:MAG: PKD domain-containing protein [bacterium]
MKRTALILLALIIWPNFSLAAVKTISFDVSPSVLGVGEIGKFVAKFLDDGGQSIPVGETVSLDLQSSCSSGQFSSSNTNWEAVTSLRVNSNWSSRTFYYKDSSAGSCTIESSVAGKSWAPASASVTIGAGGVSGDSADIDDEDVGGVTEATNTDKKAVKKETAQLSLDIGKKLTTTAGVLLVLKAKIKGVKDGGGSKIAWSFGDGGVSTAGEVGHLYEYSGVYTVVASVVNGIEQAEARTEIEVIEPKVSIVGVVDSGRAIKLENKAGDELRLDGSRLSVLGQSFVFPVNTLIKKGAQVTVSYRNSGLLVAPLDTIKLISPTGKELASYHYGLKEVSWRKLNSRDILKTQAALGSLSQELKQIEAGYAKIKSN